ncbi:MAG: HNH endonuclease [Clostridiaceae bacterium]|nr:HNH endonuclease [Clostridiaceae bacterium]
MEEQKRIRLAAFNWLKEQTMLYGDVLPRELLARGFEYDGQRITLLGPQGIWKPKALSVPLSVTTVYDGPYDDAIDSGGFLQYRYRGTDPEHRDNKGLREAMEKQIPLIYFYGIVPGKYLAVWPVYIIGDNPSSLTFTIAADDISTIENHLFRSQGYNISSNSEIAVRRYITSSVRQRLHQKSFRERVLLAYSQQCAFCRIRHIQLLDAAHIIPDGEELGDPVVNNGISLCKIHHAAFDANIIGVTPDYIIEVREDILEEKDGPMLKHGIQELQHKKIILPHDKAKWPDRERLYIKYTKFKKTG